MASLMYSVSSLSRQHLKASFIGLFFITTCSLILMTILFIPYSSLSPTDKDKLVVLHSHHTHFQIKPALKSSITAIFPPTITATTTVLQSPEPPRQSYFPPSINGSNLPERESLWPTGGTDTSVENISEVALGGQRLSAQPERSQGNLNVNMNNKEVFHNRDIFLENYMQMNKTMKIYVYPHQKNDPFANVLLPVNYEPSGNYASESYFKKALSKSHFLTKDPSEADLFFLPFSIASLRHDKRVGVGGIQNFIRDYIYNISHKYPYWNRTGGADHFYVACHSVGRTAMEKALEVRINAIQVVCSSSYFLPGYVTHKDASIPQIWPRQGAPPNRDPSKREKLAFYAGAMNSRVRKTLVQTWSNDTEIFVHQNRLKTPYSESLLGSKYCIHAKGFEVNTARIGDALFYGCVPVILADHYDLPFADILNWSSFSVVVSTLDIPLLKKILKENNGFDEYLRLQKNVLKVRDHFQWHHFPVDFDAFYMVMYELWLRRSSVRVHSSSSFYN